MGYAVSGLTTPIEMAYLDPIFARRGAQHGNRNPIIPTGDVVQGSQIAAPSLMSILSLPPLGVSADTQLRLLILTQFRTGIPFKALYYPPIP